MEPHREIHEGIEIRYGYSSHDDDFHAHFFFRRKGWRKLVFRVLS